MDRKRRCHFVHERFDGQTEGHFAHDGWLFVVCEDDVEIRLRFADEVFIGARRMWAGSRAQLRGVWAAGEWGDEFDV